MEAMTSDGTATVRQRVSEMAVEAITMSADDVAHTVLDICRKLEKLLSELEQEVRR